jgi:Na+-transporting NADH:ubiquinone oxidoreductase subunit NqrD
VLNHKRAKQSPQSLLINIHKESANITLEDPSITSVVVRTRSDKVINSLPSQLRTFIISTAITIIDKMSIIQRIQVLIDQVMHDTITKRSSKNLSFDRISIDKTS